MRVPAFDLHDRNQPLRAFQPCRGAARERSCFQERKPEIVFQPSRIGDLAQEHLTDAALDRDVEAGDAISIRSETNSPES